MLKLVRRLRKNKKGAALVEYALIVAGVALIGAVAVSLFGHKVSDMLATAAAVLPGAHADDNAPIVSGKTIETSPNAQGTSIRGATPRRASVLTSTRSPRPTGKPGWPMGWEAMARCPLWSWSPTSSGSRNRDVKASAAIHGLRVTCAGAHPRDDLRFLETTDP